MAVNAPSQVALRMRQQEQTAARKIAALRREAEHAAIELADLHAAIVEARAVLGRETAAIERLRRLPPWRLVTALDVCGCRPDDTLTD